MEKLRSGQKFSEVATAYSEDKARHGVSCCYILCMCVVTYINIG